MATLALQKTTGGVLVPVDQPTIEEISKIKLGHGLIGEFKRARNVRFHRKVMALFKFAFDMWDAPKLEYKGEPVNKTFEGFRKDLTVMAGHYEARTNMRGEVRLDAKSLSFGNMAEDEFEKVFRDLLNTIWRRVLRSKGYESPEQVDRILEELMRFEQ